MAYAVRSTYIVESGEPAYWKSGRDSLAEASFFPPELAMPMLVVVPV